ncbi:MAG TPA: TIGR03067 domain-containing protein [Mucilaginibacter sp.]|jgi:uncharacterized protein (TIGR03067 family)|nr:TIGR03067 domain-containing protein [Mucilaginibacter sp.]
MRSITFILVLAAAFFVPTAVHAQTRADSLTGSWIPVKEDFGGKPFPKAAFEKQKLIIGDSTYTVVAESVDKGIVKYNGNKMDIYGREGANAGKHFMAIYKLENGELTICYNLKGDSYPDTFDTTGKPSFFVSVFKKETN